MATHVFEFVTCDDCNPSGDLKNEDGKGYFEGPLDSALACDWTISENQLVQRHICPDCLYEPMLGEAD